MHQDKEVKAAEVWTVAADAGLQLGDKGEQSQRIRLGKMLADMRDRVFTVEIEHGPKRLRLESAGDHNRAKLWRLRQP